MKNIFVHGSLLCFDGKWKMLLTQLAYGFSLQGRCILWDASASHLIYGSKEGSAAALDGGREREVHRVCIHSHLPCRNKWEPVKWEVLWARAVPIEIWST